MTLWSNKCSEFEHISQADKNGTCMNDYQGKQNMTEWLTESTWAAMFQFSDKSKVKHNLGINYVQ